LHPGSWDRGTADNTSTSPPNGDEHPLTVSAEVLTEGERVEATASFEVPYVAWGLRDPSVFLLRVAKSVTVTVELAGTVRSD
jgi:hypothetical protein